MNQISVRTETAVTRGGFTLVELLVVIAIIAILAGLLLSTAGYLQEKAGNERAKTEIAALSNALEAYKLDTGDYPTKEADGGNASTKVLIDALSPSGTNDVNPTGKMYFSGGIPDKMLGSDDSQFNKQSSADKLKNAQYLQDPFGNPYHYQYPGKDGQSGKGFFDLWSKGKKNSEDTNTWIKNW
jgi:general secretion pathway protein G